MNPFRLEISPFSQGEEIKTSEFHSRYLEFPEFDSQNLINTFDSRDGKMGTKWDHLPVIKPSILVSTSGDNDQGHSAGVGAGAAQKKSMDLDGQRYAQTIATVSLRHSMILHRFLKPTH